MKKRIFIGILFIACIVAAVSCGGTNEEPALTVSGLVEESISAKTIKDMESLDVEFTEKDDSVSTYTGVQITAILDSAGVTEFSVINMIASDGYSAEVSSDELDSCLDCIVAPDGEGGWRTVMPGFSGKLQVKDLVELNIQ